MSGIQKWDSTAFGLFTQKLFQAKIDNWPRRDGKPDLVKRSLCQRHTGETAVCRCYWYVDELLLVAVVNDLSKRVHVRLKIGKVRVARCRDRDLSLLLPHTSLMMTFS